MAFTNLFRRHSVFNETQGANYVCMDENSIAETLLDELETQCQNISTSLSSKTKRNSEVLEHSGGLLASTRLEHSQTFSSYSYFNKDFEMF
ncbi:unnamed protein product [Rotaria sp. Silwood1]|nr:unnamed protein product [Rotaria sp. Silwood1]